MTATPEVALAAWHAFLGPAEGVFSIEPKDPGNWTGGEIGVGELKGTKYGIAASSHPGLDIASLTLQQAMKLRKTEYWDAVRGDELHPSVAFVLAEAAYGSGPHAAISQMQQTLGVTADGILGPRTMLALEARAEPHKLDDLLVEFNSRRLLFEASLDNWPDAQGGWTRRLFRGLLVARSLA